jgi:DNA alkylation repair enzyme
MKKLGDTMDKIAKQLISLSEEKYRLFQEKLVPDNKYEILGIRVPILRNFAKKMEADDKLVFLQALPHSYYDENILHSILISNMKDYDDIIANLETFLPFVDNWAVCDCISPKIMKKYPDKFYSFIVQCTKSKHTYTIRFAIDMLLQFYLDEHFDESHLSLVKNIVSEEYYVNMAKAWYFSMALVKQYDSTIKLIEEKSMDKFVQNKSIQKARESYKIDDETKKYLLNFKI